MIKENSSSILSYLEWQRDRTAELLKIITTDLEDYEDILSHFNRELNMCQFVIDNINDSKTLEDNPYFWPWVDDKINFFKTVNQELFVAFANFKRYVEGG